METRACEASMRHNSDSFDISNEKTATIFPSRTAAFSAMLMAHAVLPSNPDMISWPAKLCLE